MEKSKGVKRFGKQKKKKQKVKTLAWAGQPDIVRASKKDEYHLTLIRQKVTNAFKIIFGDRFVSMNENNINIVADACYYATTTLRNTPTLGEEYCDIIQANHKSGLLQPFRMKLLLVLSKTLLPEVILRGLLGVTQPLSNLTLVDEQAEYTLNPKLPKYYHWKKKCAMHIRILARTYGTVHSIQAFYETCFRIALIIFYLKGNFIHISNRITNTGYLFHGPNNESRQTSYKFLGYLVLIQQMVMSLNFVRDAWTLHWQEIEVAKALSSRFDSTSDVEETTGNDCMICCEPRKKTMCTPCGHLYCYSCIMDCFPNSENAKCPQCRHDITLQSLSPVYHYDEPCL
mmetsp:Transcript_8676/g.12819  ORF Transcript_8676/g.12819 Transcript_8676/m.12819 type:complete len:343 (-) Transcript_8676:116-1144(-)